VVLADSSCLEIKYLFVLEPLLQTFVSLSVCLSVIQKTAKVRIDEEVDYITSDKHTAL